MRKTEADRDTIGLDPPIAKVSNQPINGTVWYNEAKSCRGQCSDCVF